MLAQNGVETGISETDRAYRAGLNAFFAKDYNRAAYELQRVTQLAPEHQDAQEYLQKARSNGGDPALGSPAEQGGGSLALILGAIAGVLAIAGGAFFLMRRRHHRQRPLRRRRPFRPRRRSRCRRSRSSRTATATARP